MFIFREVMSILARSTFFPVGIPAVFISSNSVRFSSTLLALAGSSLPGSVSVPLYSLICSAERSDT